MTALKAVIKFGPRGSALRRHDRYKCFIRVKVHFLDHGFDIDGFADEISLSGMRFIPEQTYIMRRTNAAVRIQAGEIEFLGTLRNASPQGYGIEMRELLTEAALEGILAKYPAISS